MAINIPESGLVDAGGGEVISIIIEILLIGDVRIITTRILLRHGGDKGIQK